MNREPDKGMWLWLAILVVLVLVRSRGCELPNVVAPSKVTAVVYVHAVKAPIPDAVSAALSKLNEQDILATHYAKGTTDGPGEIPDQYKAAVAAATDLPSLVALAGDRVVRVVKAPTTEEQVLEAAK